MKELYLILIVSSFMVIYFNSIYYDMIKEVLTGNLFNCILCLSFWVAFPIFYLTYGNDIRTMLFVLVPLLSVILDKKINEL